MPGRGIETGSDARGVVVQGSHAYVADGHAGLQIIDITNPASPEIVGSIDTPDWAYHLAVSDGYVYLTDWDAGLQVIDVADPGNPVIVAALALAGPAGGIVLSGQSRIADWDVGMQVIDVANPLAPELVATVARLGAVDVDVWGDRACLVDGWDLLLVIDVAEPRSPTVVGSLEVADPPRRVAIADSLVCIGYTTTSDGVLIADMSEPQAIRVLADIDVGQRPGQLVWTGVHLLVGGWSGIQAIDLEDPAFPVIVADVAREVERPGGGARSPLRRQRLDRSGGGGGPPDGESAAAGRATVAGRSGPRGAGLAYAATIHHGLMILDVADPQDVAVVSDLSMPGDAQDVALSGRYAVVACEWQGVHVVDVDDPADPVLVASVETPGSARRVEIAGGHAFVVDDYQAGYGCGHLGPLASVADGRTVSPERRQSAGDPRRPGFPSGRRILISTSPTRSPERARDLAIVRIAVGDGIARAARAARDRPPIPPTRGSWVHSGPSITRSTSPCRTRCSRGRRRSGAAGLRWPPVRPRDHRRHATPWNSGRPDRRGGSTSATRSWACDDHHPVRRRGPVSAAVRPGGAGSIRGVAGATVMPTAW